MAVKSNIQWTDATWNIARGCTKVDEDCKFCYMYRESLNGTRYEPKEVTKTKGVFTMPLRYKEVWSKCWNGKPLIFASSLTDWGHPAIDSYRHEMFSIIRQRSDLVFQLLTKRTERLDEILPEDWGEGYKNVWLGTSIGSNDSLHRMFELVRTPARTKFLSLEPMHGEIDLEVARLYVKRLDVSFYALPGIDWVIVGGESGNENGQYRYRECKIEWIEKVIEQCRRSHIPVFVKQLGTHLAKQLKLSDRHGGNIDEWPEHLRIREFPRV
jgi:protein gp37